MFSFLKTFQNIVFVAKPVETPLMNQYNQAKAIHPDAILLFRVGDFYETFSSKDRRRGSGMEGTTKAL